MRPLTADTVTELLDTLAALLPFPTVVYTDMGAQPWTPQLHFGPVEDTTGLPCHRVGIDLNTPSPVWWTDLDGGMRTIVLDDVHPHDLPTVATRITAEYQQYL